MRAARGRPAGRIGGVTTEGGAPPEGEPVLIRPTRDSDVQVTYDTIRVAGRSYPLVELDRVWHQRGPRSWRAVARRGALGAILVGPLVAAAIALVIALNIEASPLNKLAMVVAAALLGLVVAPLMDLVLEHFDRSYARGAHTYQICAHWRGSPVLLVETNDALRFGQIYRALQRALEAHQPPSPYVPRPPRPRGA
jgi:hypothetical protein